MKISNTEKNIENPSSIPGLSKSKKWRGPVYLSKSTHLSDLKKILYLLKVMTSIDAPLPEGFGVAAIDAVDNINVWNSNRFAKFTAVLFLLLFWLGSFLYLFYLAELYRDFAPVFLMFTLLILSSVIIFLYTFPKKRLERVLLHIKEKLESGNELSEVMKEMDRLFPSDYSALIQISEKSSQTGYAVEILNKRLKQTLDNRKILLFPVIETLVNVVAALIVVFLLSTYYAPVVVGFKDNYYYGEGVVLARFIEFWKYTSMFVLIVFQMAVFWKIFSAIFFKKNWGVSLYLLPLLLIPWLRKIIQYRIASEISRELKMMLSAGVSLNNAMNTLSENKRNLIYRKSLKKISFKVENGDKLSRAISDHFFLFPKNFTGYVELGEFSGQLPLMLGNFSEYAETTVNNRVKTLCSLVQPVSVLCMGYFVSKLLMLVFRYG